MMPMILASSQSGHNRIGELYANLKRPLYLATRNLLCFNQCVKTPDSTQPGTGGLDLIVHGLELQAMVNHKHYTVAFRDPSLVHLLSPAKSDTCCSLLCSKQEAFAYRMPRAALFSTL